MTKVTAKVKKMIEKLYTDWVKRSTRRQEKRDLSRPTLTKLRPKSDDFYSSWWRGRSRWRRQQCSGETLGVVVRLWCGYSWSAFGGLGRRSSAVAFFWSAGAYLGLCVRAFLCSVLVLASILDRVLWFCGLLVSFWCCFLGDSGEPWISLTVSFELLHDGGLFRIKEGSLILCK